MIVSLILLTILLYIIYLKWDSFRWIERREPFTMEETYQIQFTGGTPPGFKTKIYTLTVPTKKQETMAVASGTKNQSYYTIIQILSQLMPITNKETNGTNQNLDLLNSGSINLAICQEDLAIERYNNNQPNLEFICGLFDEYFILLGNQKKGINSWRDLKGKKVGFPSVRSGSFQNGVKIAKAYDLEPGVDFQYKNIDSTNRLVNLLLQDKLDAIYLTTNTKNPYLINIVKNLHIKAIGVSDIDPDIIQNYFPHGRPVSINSNQYLDTFEHTDFIKTFAVRAVLVTNKDVNPDIIYYITKQIFQNIDWIRTQMKHHLHNRQLKNDLPGAFIPSEMFHVFKHFPIHQGAKKYYQEIGFLKQVSKN